MSCPSWPVPSHIPGLCPPVLTRAVFVHSYPESKLWSVGPFPVGLQRHTAAEVAWRRCSARIPTCPAWLLVQGLCSLCRRNEKLGLPSSSTPTTSFGSSSPHDKRTPRTLGFTGSLSYWHKGSLSALPCYHCCCVPLRFLWHGSL